MGVLCVAKGGDPSRVSSFPIFPQLWVSLPHAHHLLPSYILMSHIRASSRDSCYPPRPFPLLPPSSSLPPPSLSPSLQVLWRSFPLGSHSSDQQTHNQGGAGEVRDRSHGGRGRDRAHPQDHHSPARPRPLDEGVQRDIAGLACRTQL